MENRYRDGEIEIDLLDLLYHVALKWRMMIVVGLIAAVLAGCYQIYQNVKSNRLVDDYEAYKQLEQEETEELETTGNIYEDMEVQARKEALDSLAEEKTGFTELSESEIRDYYRLAKAQLTEDQLKTVEDAVYMYGSLLDREKYEEQSIWVNLDYENVGTGFVLYHVDTGHTVNYNGISEDDYREALRDAYIAYLNNSSEITGIDWSDNIIYIRELFSAQLTSDGNISIRTYAENEEKARELEDAIEGMMNSYTATLSAQIGEHSLIKISELYDTGEVRAVKNSRDSIKAEINSYKQTMKSYYSGFNIYQIAKFFYDVRSEYGETVSISEILSENATYVETYMKYTGGVPVRVSITRSVIKMVVIGGIIGVFIIILIYAVYYVLNGRIKSGREVCDAYGYCMLGNLDAFHFINPKREKNPIDRWIYSWKNRKKETETSVQEYAIATTRLTCQKQDVRDVVIATSEGLDEKAAAFADRIKNELGGAGITADISENLAGSTTAIEKASKTGKCILLSQIGVTRREDLSKTVEFINAQEINVIGMISM